MATSIHSVSAPTITEMSAVTLFGATRSVPALVPAKASRWTALYLFVLDISILFYLMTRYDSNAATSHFTI